MVTRFPDPPPTKLSHSQTAQSQTLALQHHTVATGNVHDPHARPRLPTPRRLWGPRWILHSGSYFLPPGSPACVRGRSCRDTRSRQRPARGWPRAQRLPIPTGPTLKAGDQPGRLRGAATPRAQGTLAAAGSTRDPQETARDPALASPCAPAPGQAELAERGGGGS